MSAKPRTLAVATTNSTIAVIAVTTFASTIVAKPFRYPCAMAARTDLSGAHLFLDAFEDDDVRVGRDPEGQHEAREARQRQRDVEDEDGRVEERGVDREAGDRDQTEEAVEDEQEDRDEDQTCDRRAPGLLERILAERCGDVGAIERLELDRQGTGLEHERDVLRLLQRVEALDLRASAADSARQARIGEVDLREGLDLAVEDDREVLRLLAQFPANPLVTRDALEGVGAGIRELHRHDGAPTRTRAGVEVRPGP